MPAEGRTSGGGTERRVRHERRRDVARLAARLGCLAAALDQLPHPILLVIPGQPLRVWHANAAARRRCIDGALLALSGDVLAIPAGTCGIHLMNAVRRALVQGPGRPQSVALAPEPARRIAARIHIQAIDVDADAELPFARILMLEVDERTAAHAALRSLCSEFGLTPREAEIALRLHTCGSAHELAREAGKSIHTVRSQIKSAMQKTNTRTQAGLVALVGSRLQG